MNQTAETGFVFKMQLFTGTESAIIFNSTNNHMRTKGTDMTIMELEETGGLAGKNEGHLQTMVVYSDRGAISKVMMIHQRVLQQFTSGHPVHTVWWAMESLKDKVLFEASCRHAAEANLVFLALTISGELPLEIKTWLATVLAKNTKPDLALVALLGTADHLPGEVNLLDNYLHEQARNAGIDYFIYWHQQTPSLDAGFLPNHHPAIAGTPAFSSMATDRGAEPRWGLNE